MKLLYILILTSIGLNMTAQKNILTCSFQESYKNKQYSSENSSNRTFFQKAKGNALPYIQFIHFLSNNIGVGVQFSYQQTRLHNIQNNFIQTPNYYLNDEGIIKQDIITFALSIHDKFIFKNYTFSNAIKIPFEYYGKSRQTNSGYYYYSDSPSIHYNPYSSYTLGRPAIITGIYYQANLYRKLFHNFHAYCSLNIGLDYLRYFGYTTKTSFNLTNNTSTTLRYKTTNTYQINIYVKPSFGISYFLN